MYTEHYIRDCVGFQCVAHQKNYSRRYIMTNLITCAIYIWCDIACLVCICTGDITAQGFEKKKTKLLAPYLTAGEFLMLLI